MDVYEMVAQARDATSVKRVYGEPYEKEGVTIIPAARVSGGGGGGSGAEDENQGSGGGYGVSASPVGAYVIRNGEVKWQPAFNLNRVILGGQLVVVAALLVVRAIVNSRRPWGEAQTERSKGFFRTPFNRLFGA